MSEKILSTIRYQLSVINYQLSKKIPPQYPTSFGKPTTRYTAKMWNIVPRATARSCEKRSDSFSFYYHELSSNFFCRNTEGGH